MLVAILAAAAALAALGVLAFRRVPAPAMIPIRVRRPSPRRRID